ncbi:hypothetical protein HPB52_014960 [Rhipicephalus sanguineus]|uniref:Uncharacterized protein n=1 Tax=Rhipicephalus sanguineus TaxID=34632 RepID=A0A9D4PD37_RHISA|nr:hypothetical protein HPB52_014960 [Rhipicephalus sanguineus]
MGVFLPIRKVVCLFRGPREVETSQSQLATVSSPNVTMRITDRQGDDVFTAQVGDPLALRFEIIDSNSPYEIFVRELVAMDGVDSSEILLVDSHGYGGDPVNGSALIGPEVGLRGIIHLRGANG